MRHRLNTLFALFVVFVLGIAACGDGEETTSAPGETSATSAPETTAADSGDAGAEEPADTTTPAGDPAAPVDTTTAAAGGGGGGQTVAVLTIGDETWEFTSYLCAFGHEATQSDLYSFSSGSFGEHSSGARVQFLADIRDETGQGRYEGDGVIYDISLDDIDDFENPSVRWSSTSDEADPQLVELGAAPPSGEAVIDIDGDRITVTGLFDDGLTDDYESVPGSLDATCTERRG